MARKQTAEKADSIIQSAKDCLKNYQEREGDNIQRAEEAIRFRAGEQWPDAIRNERENRYQDGGPRPCPVLDKTNQFVRQVINEERQNRAAIRIRPVDDKSDPKVAEVLTGIIRHIEDASEALVAYTTAGEHAIDGGFGFWRILTEYTDPMSFDQDIRIKRIHNRFSVALGPHTESDGSDAREAVIWEDMRREDFEAEYPDADPTSFDNQDGWSSETTIRVAEYMCVRPESIIIHQMPDGSVVTDEQFEVLRKQGGELLLEPVSTRTAVKDQVKWYKLTGKEILDQSDMLGSYIPVVKVAGNEITMPDGKIRLSGMIEAMMDPQRLHNYAHAGFIEHVALAPRAPWIAEETQVEGYEADYENANRKPITLLKYKGTSDETGQPLPPPQRTPPAGIAPGWQQMLMNTEHGIEGAVGMYGPSVGAMSMERTGVALMEQKTQGMIGNFHFPDNLARSIQHTGRILLQWIPGIYDANRVARMLGEDGNQELVYLNQDQPEAVMPKYDRVNNRIGSVYNLNVGKYDVAVSTGPSYTARRQEAADNLIQLLRARPELMNVIGDLVFSNMDTPGSEKIAERLKALLPPVIKQAEQGKGAPPVDPRIQALAAQLEQAKQEIANKGQILKRAEMELEQVARQTEKDKTMVETARKELAAERKVMVAEARARKLDLENRAIKLSLAEKNP